MSKAARKLCYGVIRDLQEHAGVAKSAALGGIIMPLAEAAVGSKKLNKRIKRLARAVDALTKAEAPPMPKSAGMVPLTAGDYITELRRVTGTQVNGVPHPGVEIWNGGHRHEQA